MYMNTFHGNGWFAETAGAPRSHYSNYSESNLSSGERSPAMSGLYSPTTLPLCLEDFTDDLGAVDQPPYRQQAGPVAWTGWAVDTTSFMASATTVQAHDVTAGSFSWGGNGVDAFAQNIPIDGDKPTNIAYNSDLGTNNNDNKRHANDWQPDLERDSTSMEAATAEAAAEAVQNAAQHGAGTPKKTHECSTCGKRFGRGCVLKRHYQHVHNDGGSRQWLCMHKNICLNPKPFRRRDHYRDHLRSRHKEDLPKRGEVVDEAWLDRCIVRKKYWICVSCLSRNPTQPSQTRCQSCAHECEPLRIERRLRL